MRKTIGLIILSVALSIIYWSLVRWCGDTELLASLLLFSGDFLIQGHFWVTFTALFIHADLMHLAGNMLFLYVFGTALEDQVGAHKTLTAFFTGGILSFILSTFFYGSSVVMFGASAAIFTLAAVVMLSRPLKFSWAYLMPLGLIAILYFVYNILAALSANVNGNIGYVGHTLGFAIGFPFGVAWNPREWRRNLLIAIVLLIAYFILMCLSSYVLVGFSSLLKNGGNNLG